MRIFVLAAFLKVIVSLMIAQRSEFVPDEFHQSTEVAHVIHFRKGHMTWEWLTGLRSGIIPVIIAAVYRLGSLIGLDNYVLYLTLAPQLLQAGLSVYGYACFIRFAERRMGKDAAACAKILFIINWFTTFCGARLISNQTEMSLNCICLWLLETRNLGLLTVTLGINFIIRPTAAIFWMPFFSEFVQIFLKMKYLNVVKCLLLGVSVLTMGLIIDALFYGKLLISWWEFFLFNFVQRGSADFGVHHPLWYLYSGLPSILGPLVVLLPFGFIIQGETRRLSIYVGFYIMVYSCIDHKEIRFLLPVLPLIFCILGSVIVNRFMKGVKGKLPGSSPDYRIKCLWMLVALNVVAAIYIGLHHQQGIKPAARFIRKEIQDMKTPKVWILMPCYNVPVFTYLHHPTAEYEYYICVPKRFEHLYTTGANDPLIQPNGFSTVNLESDIRRKLLTVGPPDVIMAFNTAVPRITSVFDEIKIPYEIITTFHHSSIGDFPKYVAILRKKWNEEALD